MGSINAYHSVTTLAYGWPAAYLEVREIAKALKIESFSVTVGASELLRDEFPQPECFISASGFESVYAFSWKEALAEFKAQIPKKYSLAIVQSLPFCEVTA